MQQIKMGLMPRLATALCLCALATSAWASSDYYLKIGDIKGESTDSRHKDWIVIESTSSGVARTKGSSTVGDVSANAAAAPRDAASGLPTGKRQHKPLVVSGGVDAATPVMAAAPPSGEGHVHIITGVPAAAAAYLRAACDSGDAIKEATIGQRSTSTETVLQDVTVSCPADGSFQLNAKHQKTGHVTLMK